MKCFNLMVTLLLSLSIFACKGGEATNTKLSESSVLAPNAQMNWTNRLNEVDEALTANDMTKSIQLLQQLMKDYEREHKKNEDQVSKDRMFQMVERLTIIASQKGDYETALFHELNLVSYYKERWGENSEQYLTALANIGSTYQLMGRTSEAIEIRKNIVDKYKQIHPTEPMKWLGALQNLAKSLYKNGDYLSAEKYDLEQLDIIQKAKGNYDASIIPVLNGLASDYIQQKRYKEAHQLYIRGLEIAKKHYSSDHINIIVLEKNLKKFESEYGSF